MAWCGSAQGGRSTDPEHWAAQAHSAAQRHLLRHLATSPLSESGTGAVSWVVTGIDSNTHNGVTDARLSERTAAAAINATIGRFRARQLPAIWFVDDASTPVDLGARLEAAGCRPERSAWVMGANLADLPTGRRRLPPGVVIEEVTDVTQLDSWFRAARGVSFDDDESSSHRRRRLYASLGLGAGRPWRHWLASEGGHPIGTASGLFIGDVVALEHIGVVPEHRRRGVGSALTLAPITAAGVSGLRAAVLGPSSDGQPLYEALGFALTSAVSDREYYLPL